MILLADGACTSGCPRIQAQIVRCELPIPSRSSGDPARAAAHAGAHPRIQHLRAAPGCVRFLSVEPLLEDIGKLDLQGINWVIVGGESGAGARPLDPAWVESIRDQCVDQRVPFFFKQWGGFQKKKAGRELDGRTYDDMPPLLTV